MIVNTEWGAFGDQSELDFILTKWDREVDRLSINPGKQIFEKMISGMYMGEVVRQVLIDLVHEGLIFVGQNTENLFQHGRFYTKYVSEVESDPVGDFTRCRLALEDLEMENVTEEDCSALRYLCLCLVKAKNPGEKYNLAIMISEKISSTYHNGPENFKKFQSKKNQIN